MTLKDFNRRVDAVMVSEDLAFNKFMEASNHGPLVKAPGNLVIYIEDDPDQVSMFKTLVSKYSTLTVIPAFTASDGRRLLSKKNGRVKCIVMDIGLNNFEDDGVDSGLNLLVWIRLNYPNTPVLVLTSHLELVSDIKERHPDVEIHIKAQESVENLIRSIELVAIGV